MQRDTADFSNPQNIKNVDIECHKLEYYVNHASVEFQFIAQEKKAKDVIS